MSKSKSQKIPGWFWLLAGILLGAMVVYLMGLSRLDLSVSIRSKPGPNQTSHLNQKTAKAETPSVRETRTFSFYKALTEHEVPVTVTPPSQRQETPEWYYIIQVASFKSAKDANDVRAKLILENFDAYGESSKNKSGDTWHRILVGPYQNRSQMEKARSRLQAMRFNPMPIKRKIEQ